MKIAVLAITKHGIEKGQQVEEVLSNSGHIVTFFIPGKYSLLKLKDRRVPFRKPLREMIADLMSGFDAIVCVMALGIVVRLIGSHLQNKKSDPAVVVLDELGQNVISVLSGHWGGANDLAKKIATEIGANPVITTATDVHGLPAIEVLAKEKGWGIDDFNIVRNINAAIVNTAEVYFYCDEPVDIDWPKHIKQFPVDLYDPRDNSGTAKVVVTNKLLAGEQNSILFLRPKNLVVGIGCRKGISEDQIQDAVSKALAKAGMAFGSIGKLASVDIKAEEPALLATAEKWQVPVGFYSVEQINQIYSSNKVENFESSAFVKEQIGVDGVCEPTALLAVGQKGRLVLPKMTLNGVTVAIAEAI